MFGLGFLLVWGDFFPINLNLISCVLRTVKSHFCCMQQEHANPKRTPQEGHCCPGQWLQGVSEPGVSTAGQGCVGCEEVNHLLCLVVELKEERLGSIRESEREIEWWSYTSEHSMGNKQ